jgi:hypothetical protein
MFGFGVGFGGLLMFLQGYNIPFQLVSPAKWKRAEGLTKDKELSLGKARSLWPGAPLTRKKDDGVAEALLMAHWLARNYLTKNTE